MNTGNVLHIIATIYKAFEHFQNLNRILEGGHMLGKAKSTNDAFAQQGRVEVWRKTPVNFCQLPGKYNALAFTILEKEVL